MFGRKHKVNKRTTPMFRHGQESCERDLHLFGQEWVEVVLAFLLYNDPDAWYTLGYQARATEGDAS